MRIVSFLPAGTEIVHALGAGGELLGRSHECDYPAEVTRLPVVSRPALALDGKDSGAVDRAVAERLQSGESLYQVDELLLRELDPELVITQDLCQVCAPSGNELTRALRELPRNPKVLRLTPQTIEDIEANIREVGTALDRADQAENLIAANRVRLQRVGRAVREASRKTVVFLEWIDPLFAGGHWVPEMIDWAGGKDPLGRAGAHSERVTWEQVLSARPELLIVAPCGYGLEQSLALARLVPAIAGVSRYAVDANAYFARPGPRVAEGVELLAHLIHPDCFAWPHPTRPWARLD